MKKILLITIAALAFGSLLFSNSYADDNNKPDSLKSSISKENASQSQDTTDVPPTPSNISEDGWIPYFGERGGDKVEDTYIFLEMNKKYFHLINPRKELKLEGEIKDSITDAVFFYQVVNDVKVANEMRFYYKPDGSLDDLSGQINTEARKVDTSPAISEEQAKQIAFTDTLNINAKPQAVEMELRIGGFDGSMRLVWSFGIINGGGGIGSWLYIVDAKTGKILSVSSALRQ